MRGNVSESLKVENGLGGTVGGTFAAFVSWARSKDSLK